MNPPSRHPQIHGMPESPSLLIEEHASATPERTWDVFSHANEAIVITDADDRIVDINSCFTEMTGFQRQDVIGESPDVFSVRSRDAANPACSWQELIRLGQGRSEMNYRDKQGLVYPAIMSVNRIGSCQGQMSHHVIVLTDLAVLDARSQHLSREVYFDSLTGLPNLHLLTQLIHESMHHVRKSSGSLTLCALDIDHFKRINDRMGQTMGDELLSSFAKRLSRLLEGDDVLGRPGGDEFVLLLHRKVDNAFLSQLLEILRRPFVIDGQCLWVSGSVGVTFYPDDDVDGDMLLRHATQAMYRAKQHGRNTFHFFDPVRDRQLQIRQEERQRFAAALARQEMCLHYQPQVDMSNGQVVGMEALVRWQHPDEGLLSPGTFLPVIDGTSLEIELGEWVIDRAMAQLESWQEVGIAFPVSVNISPAHLLMPNFIDRLTHLLSRYPQVPAGMLKFEVLESAAIQDFQVATQTIRRCQSLGIDIALDDFGTGYSSLAHLRQLPVDLIKIDRSFVGDMLSDRDDMAIVESVIYMANRFHRPILAEGVETLAHARALAALGCRLVQGFGIARPMSAKQLPEWLTQWRERADWAELSHYWSKHEASG